MSTGLRVTLLSLIVAGATSCGGNDDPDNGVDTNCLDGKCDGIGGANDPFKDVGDIESREFEYIIVGSGAGGGPLAANLARQGHSVLLLEAGKETGGKLEMQVPAFHPTATETPDLAWWYFVDHYGDKDRQQQDSKITPEGILYPRGGTLGGSTAVNALITVAPKNSDWDGIASLTADDSWSAGNMRQYYDRVTRWLSVERQQVPADALFDGSLMSILTAAFKESADAGLGSPDVDLFDPLRNIFVIFSYLTADINQATMDGNPQGVYQFPLASRGHRRNGTREYLLATVQDGRRFPLRIKTQALVTKVTFADAPDDQGRWKATGVEFLDGESLYSADLTSTSAPAEPRTVRVRATREVILSAGAFNTPQLLMLSGIGARDELAAQGIETKVDLPGVGKNLQDRYEVGVVTELSNDFNALRRCSYALDDSDACFRDWTKGRGAYTSNGGTISILMKSDPSKTEPDLHIFGLPGVFKGYAPGYSVEANASKNKFTWLILKGHTQNRGGTVKLRSADPRERPQINFHYFDDGDVDQGQDVNDLTAVVNGVEFVRKIADRSDKLDLFTSAKEVWPGRNVSDRQAVGDWVKREAWGHHASCSAAIGADGDPNAVLDSKFRVRGTDGLRVVDASVFPRIPGTFIVLPIYMVSEKATDVILESLGETRNESNFP
ncbi:MAG TPA: GMC family oxidoreductase [Kofleriaceae bacterium]|nr:GMC family oxidoreductase [Kofleriaceae bacterium]